MKNRYKIIACEVMFREVCAAAAKCKNIIDTSFVEIGIHDKGEKRMSARLQEEINMADTDNGIYNAILLGFGLCNNGVRGLKANIPIVIPRAHDCITLFLGSKEKYREYFDANGGGVYFQTSGWLERDKGDSAQSNILEPTGSKGEETGQPTKSQGKNTKGECLEDLIATYGEENAQYLYETLYELPNYKKMAYINNNIGLTDQDRKKAQEIAKSRKLDFEEIEGDNSLIFRLLDGNLEEWDKRDFLIVPPGNKIEPSYDDEILGLDAV